MKLREWFRLWDEGNFDFSEKTAGDYDREVPERTPHDRSWRNEPVEAFAAKEQSLFRHVYPAAAAVLCLIMILFLLTAVEAMPPFGAADTPANNSIVTERYIEKGLAETGAVNIVAGVILDYRAFDTLGESHVLFTATIAVFILMLLAKDSEESAADRAILIRDPLLRTTAKILVPFIILFGFYVIFNGHLGPGGGFSGGAVIGGGLILYALAFGPEKLQKIINMKSYRYIVLAALLFYSIAKCYSFFCGANGLHTIFTTGTPGSIFSAGLILPLNMAVGLVVACTMYGFYSIFTRGRI